MEYPQGHIIEVENLVKKFGSFVANDHLTFYVKKGEIFGFLGANGAGKTTAIKILCGLWEPSGGKIRVFWQNLPKHPEVITCQNLLSNIPLCQ